MTAHFFNWTWQRLRSGLLRVSGEREPRGQWLEAIAIPLVFMGLAWSLKPQDPFLLGSVFPWLWFAPVLVALRYGAAPGLVSGCVLLGAWLMANVAGVAAVVRSDFPKDYFFGGGLLVLLCGKFSDVWRDRYQRMDEANLYVTERLSRLTKRHLLLNLSHDRLEQEMLARPGSLRDALTSLRDVVLKSGRNEGTLPGVEALLNLLEQYTKIESAAIYCAQERDGQVRLGVVAGSLGEPQALEPDDELLRLAIEERKLVHIAQEEVSYERPSRQLAVVPLIASDDSLVGILAVSKMPFFSLNAENLQMMSVMLAYYADHLLNAPDIALCRKALPAIPEAYAEELARMLRMQKTANINSQIVVMTFAGPAKESIPTQLLHIKRGLDLYWQTQVGENPVIAVLMPFAPPSSQEGFLHRINDWLKVRFGGDFDSLKIDLRGIDFEREDPLKVLAEILRP
jgi:hypothetical protein